MAPGLASPEPPPTSAVTLEEWCGAMNGGRVISGMSSESKPATEWIAVTSSASAVRDISASSADLTRVCGHLHGEPRLRLPDHLGEVADRL